MFIFFFILSLIIVIGTMSLDRGEIIIEWLNYHIEISITLITLVILFIFFSSYYISYFMIFLKNIPSSFKKYYHEKQNRKDVMLLLDGFTAMQRQDLNKVHWVMKRINETHEQIKTLKPLFLLLSAHYNQATNNEEALEKNYQELLKFDDLKMVALKGLVSIRLNRKLYYDALVYAEQAFKIQVKTDWLLKNLIEIYIELKQYDKAEQIIKKAVGYKFINNDESNDLLIKNFIAMANQYISNSESSNAISSLEKALKINPSSYEAVSILSRIYSQDNNIKSAQKIIIKAWKKSPSIRLARLILYLYRDYNVNKRIEIVEDLITSAPEAKESYLVMAELCIEEDLLPNARAAMDKLLAIYAPDSHMSKLMALIEAKAQNNHSTIINWLKKL